MRHQYAKCSFVLRDILKSYFSQKVRIFFLDLKDPFYLRFYNFNVQKELISFKKSLKRNFYKLYIFSNAAKYLTSNMYNIYTKAQRTRFLRKYD